MTRKTKTPLKKPRPRTRTAKPAAPSLVAPPPPPAAKPSATVTLAKAKGRPMLVWVGKRPLTRVTAFPAQLVETFDPTSSLKPDTRNLPSSSSGLLFHGDNKEIMAWMLANGFRGKVNLFYIDPPFDSGADYVRKVALRGAQGNAKLAGESYTLGEQIQYTDIWANDNHLQFMYERLILMRELMAEGGSMWLHCDWHKSHVLRCLLEEVFGPENMRGEIVWQRTASRDDAESFGHVHDTLLYFVKAEGEHTWNPPYVDYDQAYLARYYNMDDGDGRKYAADNLTVAGTRTGSSGKPWRGFDPGTEGRHWKYTIEKLEELDRVGRIYWPKGGKGFPRYKRYASELPGRPISSIWDDIFVINSQAEERGDYPTQKPEDLLQRVLTCTSNPGDLVMDCFLGSGTTAAVAQKMGRRWIGCDINKGAIQTASKRLQSVIGEQLSVIGKEQKAARESLPGLSAPPPPHLPPSPASLSFSLYRVNDYDLQIQHNEAVNLACEHVGVTRTQADPFFDGTRGKALVKVVPFGHPLTLLDLEELKRELGNRPDETRDVLMICLGKETAVDAWVEDWNKLRREGHAPNRVQVIELRTDAVYGKFFLHQPATARVDIRRKGGKLLVEIKDFLSPTIVERLKQQAGMLSPRIEDWRAMVDCVLIDPAYDAAAGVFNIALSDIPEKKSDFVAGRYELPAPDGPATVAVKVIDMLGEEVLVTRKLT